MARPNSAARVDNSVGCRPGLVVHHARRPCWHAYAELRNGMLKYDRPDHFSAWLETTL